MQRFDRQLKRARLNMVFMDQFISLRDAANFTPAAG